MSHETLWKAYLEKADSTLFLQVDGQSRVDDCNAALLRLLQRSRQEVVGVGLGQLLSPEDLRAVQGRPPRLRLKLGVPVQAWLGPRSDGQPGWQMLAETLRAERAESNLEFLLHHLQSVRTPLNTILGMAHLALKTPLTPQQREYLQFIQNGGQSLVNIADGLLQFGRGDWTLEFPLQTVLDRVRLHFERQSGPSAGSLTMAISPEVPPMLMGNPALLGDALIGLAESLLQQEPAAPLELRIRRPSARQPHLLEFHFNAPLADLAAEAERWSELGGELNGGPHDCSLKWSFANSPSSPSELPADGLRAGGSGEDVLVVEDNPLNQQIVSEILQSAGLAIELARHGEEALARLRQRGDRPPWRLILMDLEMPVMDGYETATRLRQDSRLDQVPIVAMSVHVQAEERQRCLDCGMDTFLSKPIDPEVWLRTLSRWLPLQSPPPAPSTPANSSPRAGRRAAESDWLDRATGLRRVNENATLYQRLLREFADQVDYQSQHLEAALCQENLPQLRQLAHALQGASANLGLSRVQQAAHQLEQAAAARHPEACRRLLPPLLERLEQVRIELAADDEAGSLASHTDVLVDEEAVRALQQLEVQLEGCQGEALDTLEQLRLDLGDPSWLRPLTEELSRFNFEGALDQLRRVRAQGSSAR